MFKISLIKTNNRNNRVMAPLTKPRRVKQIKVAIMMDLKIIMCMLLFTEGCTQDGCEENGDC